MKTKTLLLTAMATFGMTIATMAQNVPNYVPINGLVGWWPFNGNANDESGNGNNGTVNGATLTSDRFMNVNKAYSFDGVDDKIEINHSDSLNTFPLSVVAWVRTNQCCVEALDSAIDLGVEHLVAFTPHQQLKYKIRLQYILIIIVGIWCH